MTTPTMAHRVKALTHLTTEQLVGADGSIWSHAATLGTRIKGSEFTIDKGVVENFVRVFTTGYPCKVPVDYEHGTVNGATDFGNPVPKAGDVLELRGIYAPSDFTGELRTTAEKLAALAQPPRPLDDPRNLGLWMRWKPTRRALGMIQEGEYSELSIAFAPVPHNTTGADQGEVLLSVALTNLPFLDDMLPVAASRGGGGSPPVAGSREEHMTNPKMLAATTALTGKAVSSEDEAVTELTALQPDLVRLRALGTVIAKAFGGETDPEKVGTKITELTATVTRVEGEAKTAKAAAIKTTVEVTIKKFEDKLTVPMRTLMAKQLTTELEAGTAVDETETVKALTTMPDTGITERSTGTDIGSGNIPDDVKVDKKAKELVASDPELKELARTDPHAAYMKALPMAAQELNYKPRLTA